MPLAFFTRTQTGALISRINNDVLGAQQAFTGTLSNVVSNIISVTLVLIAMLFLSWQITLLALLMVPLFIIPARLMAKRLQSITRESYALNAEMSTQMTERFNVAGALLVKLFGRPQDEDQLFRGKARRVADIGVQQAMYARVLFASFTLVAALGTALVYGMGGYQAASNPQKLLPMVVALAAYLNRLYGPITALSNIQVDVMTALVSFDRVFEVLDLPPMIDDKPDAVALPRQLGARPRSSSTPSTSATRPRRRCHWLRSSRWRSWTTRRRSRCCTTCRPRRAGPAGGAGRPVRRREDDHVFSSSRGCTTSGRRGPGGRWDVREVTLQSLVSAVGVVTQDAHSSTTPSAPTSPMRSRKQPTRSSGMPWMRPRSVTSSADLPDQLDTVRPAWLFPTAFLIPSMRRS